jgi:hypothetical protein
MDKVHEFSIPELTAVSRLIYMCTSSSFQMYVAGAIESTGVTDSAMRKAVRTHFPPQQSKSPIFITA